MGAKAEAIRDIRAELRNENKSFIEFNKALNPIIKEIVRSHILMMRNKSKKRT